MMFHCAALLLVVVVLFEMDFFPPSLSIPFNVVLVCAVPSYLLYGVSVCIAFAVFFNLDSLPVADRQAGRQHRPTTHPLTRESTPRAWGGGDNEGVFES